MGDFRIFITDDFHDFMKVSKLSEQDIVKSATELSNGLYDADLSGCVYKKRIAPHGRSKSDFGRAIVAFKFEKKIFFIDGWEKKNVPKSGPEISNKLLLIYKAIAKDLLNFTEQELNVEIRSRLLYEVHQYGR